MLIAVLMLAMLWAAVLTVVLGMCISSARGDRVIAPTARPAKRPARGALRPVT